MTSIFELQQFFKKFNIFNYTGDKLGDLELMEMELRELYEWKMIDIKEFQQALLVLRAERSRVTSINE